MVRTKGNDIQEDTNYLYEYFFNEDKFNDALEKDFDEELEKNTKNKNINLDSRIQTDKNPKSIGKRNKSASKKVELSVSSDPTELPSISSQSDDVEFDEEDSENSISSVENSTKSPYKSKINSIPMYNPASIPQNYANRENYVNRENMQQMPLLGDQLVDDVDRYIETPEEKRARAREIYSKLQDLVERHSVKLTRNFSIDDDPDVMEAEYNMHKERRNKTNQVKMYKQVLFTIISGTEFLNEKYNPFDVKLKDWSKQVATDMDDYTEVLEEIYEKYRDKGGKMSPEIRLLFMIIMSGVTFHLSQSLFGPGGLNDAISNNPNIIGKLLGGLMKGGAGGLLGGKDDSEPLEAKEIPNSNKKILESIKKYNNNNNSTEIKSESNMTTTENHTETVNKITAANQALAAEREKRLLAEQKLAFEAQSRKQNEMYAAQLEQMRNQLDQIRNQQINSLENVISQTKPYATNDTAKIISEPKSKYGFTNDSNLDQPITNNYIVQPSNNNYDNDGYNMFDSEIDSQNKSKSRTKNNSQKNTSIKKPNKKSFDESNLHDIIDSLESTDVDIDEIIFSSKQKNNRSITKKNSVSKPITTSRKPNNSATKSASKRKSDTSDTLSTSRKKGILRL
ncbi:hypothetical protein [Acanthamoeba polyphaga mimivirus]|uniref:Uncharacterized protein n=2 Tax=Megamimivirinae TaxID=3044648 RepID=A0A2L2DJ45_MIMIV|nr:hypothetical protein MegaChil _gp0439 [Megavirus chiliensis]AEQ33195.1 DUF5767 domain-containing protein [Megavirus chiliensis]AVG46170.1 hypothetical protein [Acanthamoeba polyphaga mimivirus]AVG47275.1 hypothetical protein [Acanthamoeba polyphaga mimivirus]